MHKKRQPFFAVDLRFRVFFYSISLSNKSKSISFSADDDYTTIGAFALLLLLCCCCCFFILGVLNSFLFWFFLSSVYYTMWLPFTQDEHRQKNNNNSEKQRKKSALIHCFCLLASASFLSQRLLRTIAIEQELSVKKKWTKTKSASTQSSLRRSPCARLLFPSVRFWPRTFFFSLTSGRLPITCCGSWSMYSRRNVLVVFTLWRKKAFILFHRHSKRFLPSFSICLLSIHEWTPPDLDGEFFFYAYAYTENKRREKRLNQHRPDYLFSSSHWHLFIFRYLLFDINPGVSFCSSYTPLFSYPWFVCAKPIT